jgi:hypothetical protein
MNMNAIDSSVQPQLQSQPASSEERSSGVDMASQHPIAGLRPAFETELSGVIERLIARAVAEGDAAVARAQAAGQVTLAAAEAALEEQTQRNDDLTESLLQSEIQVEALRVQLQNECEHTKAARDAFEAARDAFETEHSTRARIEAAHDKECTAREQMVSAYESRLQAVNAELDAMRAEFIGLKQQLEVEATERARLIAALRSVRQACASAEPQRDIAGAPDRPSAASPDPCASENDDTAKASIQKSDERTFASIAPVVDRHLKLVASSEVAPVDAPPHLLEYFKELFEQIDAMYQVDQQARASLEVVERLAANLRYARDVFVQRARSEGLNGATLFEQELSRKLDEVGATSLGRHLAIAAYELTQVAQADVRAEAS